MEINASHIRRRTVSGVPVLHIRGSVTRDRYGDMETVVSGLLSGNIPGIVADLSEADFIDSAGISILLACKKTSNAADAMFILCNVHPYIADVFEKLNLNTIFECAADERQAVAAVKKQTAS